MAPTVVPLKNLCVQAAEELGWAAPAVVNGVERNTANTADACGHSAAVHTPENSLEPGILFVGPPWMPTIRTISGVALSVAFLRSIGRQLKNEDGCMLKADKNIY